MQVPPSKLSPEKFNAVLAAWLTANTDGPKEARVCKTCQTPIAYETAYVSIHDATFGDSCAGSGECSWIGIPYCPKCEPNPIPTENAHYICVHVGCTPADPTPNVVVRLKDGIKNFLSRIEVGS